MAMPRDNDLCRKCDCSLHLQYEIEGLKQQLLERERHIVSMETTFLTHAQKFPNGELAALGDELVVWQDKYSRLYEAHKRVQKVNANLEDKLLKIVDKCESEKATLTSELASTLHRLAAAEEEINRLNLENERYRNDVNLAIQLLQCKPANFVSQRYDTLPTDLQQKVKRYVNTTNLKRRPANSSNSNSSSGRTIRVPISTFPPTAMVFNVPERDTVDTNTSSNSDENSSGGNEGISAAVLARVLEERQRERLTRRKHCDSCTCLTSTATTESSILTSETAEARYRHRHRYVDFIAASTPQSTESTTMRNVKCIYTTSTGTNNGASRRTKAKSINEQGEIKGGNILLEGTVGFPAAMIHSARSRSTSSNSSCEERQFFAPAETEI